MWLQASSGLWQPGVGQRDSDDLPEDGPVQILAAPSRQNKVEGAGLLALRGSLFCLHTFLAVLKTACAVGLSVWLQLFGSTRQAVTAMTYLGSMHVAI